MSQHEDNEYDTSASVSARIRNAHIFNEEYQSWRRLGHKHLTAHRRAMDYHNQFTAHEITSNWVAAIDSQVHHEDPVESHIYFNQIVRIMKEKMTAVQIRAVWYTIVLEDLDINLDEDLFMECHAVVGDTRPETMKEVAQSMGLALNNIGVCTTLRAVRNRVRDKCIELGLVPEGFKA